MENEIKIQYFIDYWKDLTHTQFSIENQLVHSILYNPKELFKEFIEEIERKNLTNNDNKNFFFDKIREFSKLNLDALSFLQPILKLIQQQFGKKEDNTHLKHLLQMAQFKLDNFKLGKEAINELAEILNDSTDINKLKMKHLVNIVIFELMHKKYSQKTIIDIINNIFSNYKKLSGSETIYTNFPHKIKCNNWDIGSDEYIEYEKALKNYMDNLTYKDRILSLFNYLDKEPIQHRFIFQIKGLKGDDVNITIGNVQIYNPKTLKLINNPRNQNDEFFKKEIDDIYYCNGAVILNIIDTEHAEQEALQLLEDTLDLVVSRYPDYKVPIVINKFEYHIIDIDGNIIGSGFTNTWEYLTYMNSLKIDNTKFANEIYKNPISKDKIFEVDKKILESMHWKRKAIESNENNEKILWHWVALENIFERKNQSNPKIIFEVVSKLLTKKFMYDFAWKHFNKLESKTNIIFEHLKLKLPDDLKTKIGLTAKENESIFLKDFIINIENILLHLDNNSLFYEQLKYLKDVFDDKKKCIELIEKVERIFFEKLIYIYRMRNKIVHNADNENNPIAEYYVKFITTASNESINTFIYKRANFSVQTNDDIINNIIYEYNEFKLELTEKGTSILLNKK